MFIPRKMNSHAGKPALKIPNLFPSHGFLKQINKQLTLFTNNSFLLTQILPHPYHPSPVTTSSVLLSASPKPHPQQKQTFYTHLTEILVPHCKYPPPSMPLRDRIGIAYKSASPLIQEPIKTVNCSMYFSFFLQCLAQYLTGSRQRIQYLLNN